MRVNAKDAKGEKRRVLSADYADGDDWEGAERRLKPSFGGQA